MSKGAHQLRILNIPSELIDIINSYLLYPIDIGIQRQHKKKINNIIKNSIRGTYRRDNLYRNLTFISTSNNIYVDCLFCVICGNYFNCINESILCLCLFDQNHIEIAKKQKFIEEERNSYDLDISDDDFDYWHYYED